MVPIFLDRDVCLLFKPRRQLSQPAGRRFPPMTIQPWTASLRPGPSGTEARAARPYRPDARLSFASARHAEAAVPLRDRNRTSPRQREAVRGAAQTSRPEPRRDTSGGAPEQRIAPGRGGAHPGREGRRAAIPPRAEAARARPLGAPQAPLGRSAQARRAGGAVPAVGAALARGAWRAGGARCMSQRGGPAGRHVGRRGRGAAGGTGTGYGHRRREGQRRAGPSVSTVRGRALIPWVPRGPPSRAVSPRPRAWRFCRSAPPVPGAPRPPPAPRAAARRALGAAEGPVRPRRAQGQRRRPGLEVTRRHRAGQREPLRAAPLRAGGAWRSAPHGGRRPRAAGSRWG